VLFGGLLVPEDRTPPTPLPFPRYQVLNSASGPTIVPGGTLTLADAYREACRLAGWR